MFLAINEHLSNLWKWHDWTDIYLLNTSYLYDTYRTIHHHNRDDMMENHNNIGYSVLVILFILFCCCFAAHRCCCGGCVHRLPFNGRTIISNFVVYWCHGLMNCIRFTHMHCANTKYNNTQPKNNRINGLKKLFLAELSDGVLSRMRPLHSYSILLYTLWNSP